MEIGQSWQISDLKKDVKMTIKELQDVSTLQKLAENITDSSNLGDWNIISKRKINENVCSLTGYDRDDDLLERMNSSILVNAFLDKPGNITICGILESIIQKDNDCFNAHNVISAIIERCGKIQLQKSESDIRVFLGQAAICGLIELRLSHKQPDINKDCIALCMYRDVLEKAYIIESIFADNTDLSLYDVDVYISLEYGQLFREYFLFNWDEIKCVRMELKSIEKIKEELDNIFKEEQKKLDDDFGKKQKKLNSEMETRFKEHMQDFYLKIMEIMGIFVAIFVLIGSNFFGRSDIKINEILISNASCTLMLLIIFFLIEKFLKGKPTKSTYHKMLIVAIVLVMLIIFVVA